MWLVLAAALVGVNGTATTEPRAPQVEIRDEITIRCSPPAPTIRRRLRRAVAAGAVLEDIEWPALASLLEKLKETP